MNSRLALFLSFCASVVVFNYYLNATAVQNRHHSTWIEASPHTVDKPISGGMTVHDRQCKKLQTYTIVSTDRLTRQHAVGHTGVVPKFIVELLPEANGDEQAESVGETEIVPIRSVMKPYLFTQRFGKPRASLPPKCLRTGPIAEILAYYLGRVFGFAPEHLPPTTGRVVQWDDVGERTHMFWRSFWLRIRNQYGRVVGGSTTHADVHETLSQNADFYLRNSNISVVSPLRLLSAWELVLLREIMQVDLATLDTVLRAELSPAGEERKNEDAWTMPIEPVYFPVFIQQWVDNIQTFNYPLEWREYTKAHKPLPCNSSNRQHGRTLLERDVAAMGNNGQCTYAMLGELLDSVIFDYLVDNVDRGDYTEKTDRNVFVVLHEPINSNSDLRPTLPHTAVYLDLNLAFNTSAEAYRPPSLPLNSLTHVVCTFRRETVTRLRRLAANHGWIPELRSVLERDPLQRALELYFVHVREDVRERLDRLLQHIERCEKRIGEKIYLPSSRL